MSINQNQESVEPESQRDHQSKIDRSPNESDDFESHSLSRSDPESESTEFGQVVRDDGDDDVTS